MGTNFYIIKNKEEIHIGKRSAAGIYCWDCKQTLHKCGAEHVHGYCHSLQSSVPEYCNLEKKIVIPKLVDERYINKERLQKSCGLFERCPKCGKKREHSDKTASVKELGFYKGPLNKTGVGTCCSFTWAILPYELRKIIKKTTKIKNEYGDMFTPEEFWKEIEDCPIQFFNLVGEEFS